MVAIHANSSLQINDFFSEIQRFDYTINREELRVQDIFVRHFNSDPEFRPPNIVAFAESLDMKLKALLGDKRLHCLEPAEIADCLQIVKAFRSLVSHHSIFEEENFGFNDMVAVFSKLIVVDPQDSEIDDLTLAQEKVRETAQVIMDIVKQVSRHVDMIRILVSNLPFIRLMVRTIKDQQIDVIPADQVLQVLNNFLDFAHVVDLSDFFILSGLVHFILDYIFNNKKMAKKNRVEFIKLLLSIHEMTASIYTAFIPPHFLIEIRKSLQHGQEGVEAQLLLEFIKDFDASEFENVFIIWNAELRRKSHERIKENCRLIWEALEPCTDL